MTQGYKPALAITLLVLVTASRPAPARPVPAPVSLPGTPFAHDTRAAAAGPGTQPAGFDLQAWLDSQHGKEGEAADWSQLLGTAVELH